MGTWRRFWRLSGFERGIALEAAACLPATWVGLRVAGFRRWKRLLGWLAPRVVPDAAASNVSLEETARQITRMEEAAARNLFFPTNCLEQSLVLWWLLRIRGIAAEMHFGARKEANRFEAHAWVEFHGAILNGPGEEKIDFVPFEEKARSMGTQTN
jgi:transglutaminase superfamily protein